MGLDRERLTASEAFSQQFNNLSKTLRTTLIAEVVAFDDVRNLVDVQPVNMTNINGELMLLPIVNHVPVVYFGAKDLWITYFPEPGDICMLMVNDRSIDNWKIEGAVTSPESDRHHDMTDSIALFGINPYTKPIDAVEPETLHIRTRDGLHGIKTKDSLIETHSIDTTLKVEPTSIKGLTENYEMNASAEAKIIVGGSTITVTPSEIEGVSATIKLDASSVVEIEGGASVTVKGPVVTIDAPITNVTGLMNVTGVITGDNFVSSATGTNHNEHVHGGVQTGGGITGLPE